MIKRLLYIAVCAVALWSCDKNDHILTDAEGQGRIYTAKVSCEADQLLTRAYDADLNWYWEPGDALTGYQFAGNRIRNTLNYVEDAGSFVCDAFAYMSQELEQFHFIYPAGAEVAQGTLVAVQNGKWQPLSVATVENATVDNLGTLTFTPLSAALELRIFETDKVTRKNVIKAELTSESDFVGKWTLNPADMTYTQTLDGKVMRTENDDLRHSTVVFNMPDVPEGFAKDMLTLTLTDVDKGTMTRTLPAMTFVKGKRTVLNIAFSADPIEDPVLPEPEEPGTIIGTLTCATYNVDGVPSSLNYTTDYVKDDAFPGADGTTRISQMVAESGWDVVAFQENFYYNNELRSNLSAYTFGTHLAYKSPILYSMESDGLGFATLNNTCEQSNEHFETFTSKYGNYFDGLNTEMQKGLRHYVVTMKDGVKFDVIITQMNNAYRKESMISEGWVNARAAQLTQVANYINSIRDNNRPIIFMGDTNCRYTRDDFETNFWSKLDADLRANLQDPWVDYQWNGEYPAYGTPSLVVQDEYDPNNGVGDIECGKQEGEVMDKILYINNPNSNVQVHAMSYQRDMNFADPSLADRVPVVVKFAYISENK